MRVQMVLKYLQSGVLNIRTGGKTSAFRRGFGGTLNVYGDPQSDRLRFERAGRDIKTTSLNEALTRDWHTAMGVIVEADEHKE